MSEFHVVDRPAAAHSRRGPGPLHVALLETLSTGQAIAITENGTSAFKIRQRLTSYRKQFKEQGLKLCSRTIAGTVHAWVESRDGLSRGSGL